MKVAWGALKEDFPKIPTGWNLLQVPGFLQGKTRICAHEVAGKTELKYTITVLLLKSNGQTTSSINSQLPFRVTNLNQNLQIREISFISKAKALDIYSDSSCTRRSGFMMVCKQKLCRYQYIQVRVEIVGTFWITQLVKFVSFIAFFWVIVETYI